MLDTELIKQWGNEESDYFQKNIGISQRDGLSAIEFTLYMSNAIYKQNNTYYDELQHKEGHNGINLEYAYNISAVTTDRHPVVHIKNTI